MTRDANTDDGSCIAVAFPGCTVGTAFNYDPNANTDDESCFPIIEGCMDTTASNYNPLNVNTEDGSCIYLGCTDESAFQL